MISSSLGRVFFSASCLEIDAAGVCGTIPGLASSSWAACSFASAFAFSSSSARMRLRSSSAARSAASRALRSSSARMRCRSASSRASSARLYSSINTLTGGTEYKPGALSPTPDQIDYIFGAFAGGVGRELNKLYQTGEAAFTDKEITYRKIPGVSRFYGTTNDDMTVASRYWRNVKELNSLEAEIRGRRRDGGNVDEVIREHTESSLIPIANKYEHRISLLRKQRSRIEFNESLTESERTQRLKERDAYITKVMGDLNRAVAEAKKQKRE